MLSSFVLWLTFLVGLYSTSCFLCLRRRFAAEGILFDHDYVIIY